EMWRSQALERAAGRGTRRAAAAAPASVLRQIPETIRDTSQLESHPAENAALSINPHPACVGWPDLCDTVLTQNQIRFTTCDAIRVGTCRDQVGANPPQLISIIIPTPALRA